MTDALRLKEIGPCDYAKAFIGALDNPHQLWDVAFRTHISPMCRHLLFSLFFCSEYGVAIDELKLVFNALHPALCRLYGLAHDPKDYEDAVRVMEGGFINIRGKTISFINPSLRDYLDGYLDDISLLSAFAVTAQKVSWARSIWHHVSLDRARFSHDDREALSVAFRPIAAASVTLPVMKQDPEPPHYYTISDISVSDRIELLLRWAGIANDDAFVQAALALSRKPVGGFSAWRDGKNLIDLVYSLRSGEYEGLACAEEMISLLEGAVVDVFDNPMDPDDLEGMCDAVDANKRDMDASIISAMHRAIIREVDDAMEMVASEASESTLSDHAKILEKL
ncbi:MAG: hypothetical protein P4L61_00365, partial [Candidatus Pacebacteria bacterium]|nr:hypothetical protein [Candidatus Paceibacterota bacterium]